MNSSRFRQLPSTLRRSLALLLAVAALVYLASLVTTFYRVTPPSAFFPETRDLNRLLFDYQRPTSRLERLLESTIGELNRGGTMRPAFTEQSAGWAELTQHLSADALEKMHREREGERLAVLAWIRSGASAQAYEQDNFPLTATETIPDLTEAYRCQDGASPPGQLCVKIRSLLTDRCVTCHSETGRHDAARFIELDSYERLAHHLQPEVESRAGRPWLIATLLALYPFALFAASLFLITQHSLRTRVVLSAITFLALLAMTIVWLSGPAGGHMLLVAAAIATLTALTQSIASLKELLDLQSTLPSTP